jgi:hypothetical protein
MPLAPHPILTYLYSASIEVATPLELGATPQGVRRIIHITGGKFSGDGLLNNSLRGEIVPGGADWQILRTDEIDTTAILEARFTMRTDDGALIYVQNWGVRRGTHATIKRMMTGEAVNPSDYVFSMTPRFETGDARYAWLNHTVAVGRGMRTPTQVIYDVYSVT